MSESCSIADLPIIVALFAFRIGVQYFTRIKRGLSRQRYGCDERQYANRAFPLRSVFES